MRTINDRNILDTVCTSFCNVLEKHAKYIIVSGFVAISSGRTRGICGQYTLKESMKTR